MDTAVSATSSPPAAAAAAAPSAPRALNLWLAAYVAVLVGKFSDWIPGLASVPLAKMAMLVAVIYAWRARKTLAGVRVRSLPVARPAVAYLSLALLSLAFSTYLSMTLAQSYGIGVLLVSFVLLVKSTQSLRDVERLLYALSLAAAGLAVAAVFGGREYGRAYVSENIDPNDVAYGLVTVLPITRALLVTLKRGRGRLILQCLIAAMLIAILLTGSRGGALGLGTVILLQVAFPLGFSRSGELKRFRIGRSVMVLALIGLLAGGLWGYLPPESRERMASLLDLGNDYNAGTSSASRSAIWQRNTAAALRRPIGYGLGTSEYVDGLTGGAYRALHNTFVEALVELGVLGFLLLCASYLSALRQLGRVSRPGQRSALGGEAAKASLYARALRIALAGNAVSGFFLSNAYAPMLWSVIAICAALAWIGRELTSSAATAAAAGAPVAPGAAGGAAGAGG